MRVPDYGVLLSQLDDVATAVPEARRGSLYGPLHGLGRLLLLAADRTHTWVEATSRPRGATGTVGDQAVADSTILIAAEISCLSAGAAAVPCNFGCRG